MTTWKNDEPVPLTRPQFMSQPPIRSETLPADCFNADGMVTRGVINPILGNDIPVWECAYCGSLHPARTAIPVNKCCNCGASRQRDTELEDEIDHNCFPTIGKCVYAVWL